MHVYQVSLRDANKKRRITREKLRFSDALELAKLWGAIIEESPSMGNDGSVVTLKTKDMRYPIVEIMPVPYEKDAL